MAIKYFSAMTLALLASFAHGAQSQVETTTPIKHLVIVMLQDESFDRYFGRYPIAENHPGEKPFHALKTTPKVAGYTTALMTKNPNLTNPYRLAPGEPTCDQGYGPLAQKASYNHGRDNMFIWIDDTAVNGINDDGCFPQSVMGYYDGNTVNSLWNYAQHYAMADHFFATDYSSKTSGLINEIAGTTQGVKPKLSPGVSYQDMLLADNPPMFDDASQGKHKIAIDRKNIGDLLSQHQVTWGAFIGGFTPSKRSASGTAILGSRSLNQQGSIVTDYVASNDPFQYFKSTSNPHHLGPKSIYKVGFDGPAHHQYDWSLFNQSLSDHNLPSVSFLIPKASQNGHVGNSSPLDEQVIIDSVVHSLKQSDYWKKTAIMLVWSNADGWYDHITPPPAPADMLGDGYGPRLPFLVISSWAKHNFVDHGMLDQASVLKFIEDNWQLGYLGKHTADRYAHSLSNMFQFAKHE